MDNINVGQLLPILLIAGGVNSIYLPLLIALYPLMKWMYEKIQNYFKKKYAVLELYDSSRSLTEIRTYTDVNWYIQHHNLLKFPLLQINDSYQRYYGGDGKTENYKVIDHERVQFDFKKHKLLCKFGVLDEGNNNKRAFLSIYAENTKVINEFIKTCTTEHNKFKKKSNDDIHMFSYDSNKWSSKKLNVVKTFENLYLFDDIKNKLINDIDAYRNNKELYKKMGIAYKRGFMFYGKPGCGKTSSINAIARMVHYDIYKIKINEFTDSKGLFKAVSIIPARSILVIEDIDRFNVSNKSYVPKTDLTLDQIIQHREKLNDLQADYHQNNEYNGFATYSECLMNLENDRTFDLSSHGKTMNDVMENSKKLLEYAATKPDLIVKHDLTTFYETGSTSTFEPKLSIADIMEIFDGNEYLHKCLIIITTNYPEKLDRALIRPGRIDTHIEFLPANKEIITNVLASFYSKPKEEVKKDLESYDLKIEQSRLINSIILPNIGDYQGCLNAIIGS